MIRVVYFSPALSHSRFIQMWIILIQLEDVFRSQQVVNANHHFLIIHDNLKLPPLPSLWSLVTGPEYYWLWNKILIQTIRILVFCYCCFSPFSLSKGFLWCGIYNVMDWWQGRNVYKLIWSRVCEGGMVNFRMKHLIRVRLVLLSSSGIITTRAYRKSLGCLVEIRP